DLHITTSHYGLAYGGYDSPSGDHTNCGRGGLCCTRGLDSFDRIELGSLSEFQTYCDMQAELLALREQPRRARQLGSDARVPDPQDAPRLKKYSELSAAEAIQADCEVKATNIILSTCLGFTTSVAQANLSTSSAVLSPTSISATYQTSPYVTSYYTPQFVSQEPSSSNHSITYPVTDTSLIVNHNAYMASSSAPQIDYSLMVQHSSEYSPPETGLVVLVFQKGDDPIDAINHMMSFLTAVVTSRYPGTNNQLRTSSNP
nr:hypothetical protein [Tanacetum cinerariifolium]